MLKSHLKNCRDLLFGARDVTTHAGIDEGGQPLLQNLKGHAAQATLGEKAKQASPDWLFEGAPWGEAMGRLMLSSAI